MAVSPQQILVIDKPLNKCEQNQIMSNEINNDPGIEDNPTTNTTGHRNAVNTLGGANDSSALQMDVVETAEHLKPVDDIVPSSPFDGDPKPSMTKTEVTGQVTVSPDGNAQNLCESDRDNSSAFNTLQEDELQDNQIEESKEIEKGNENKAAGVVRKTIHDEYMADSDTYDSEPERNYDDDSCYDHVSDPEVYDALMEDERNENGDTATDQVENQEIEHEHVHVNLVHAENRMLDFHWLMNFIATEEMNASYDVQQEPDNRDGSFK